MRIDLPCCGFKNCRYCFDGNCTKPSEQEKCEYWYVLHEEPEVIRCKDCKWYGRADKRRFYRGMDCLQKRIDTIVPDKDFCSRAERRGEEE